MSEGRGRGEDGRGRARGRGGQVGVEGRGRPAKTCCEYAAGEVLRRLGAGAGMGGWGAFVQARLGASTTNKRRWPGDGDRDPPLDPTLRPSSPLEALHGDTATR
ncbi:hypothetical protein SVAN01_06614 [Stagonosporopsis vannaccii]|nr:hypothetical protein SVAN01_06614 [Stagonosporopsis vannaccii]